MDMKEFTELLDDFGKLSDDQISEKFYDILDSLFDVIRKDVSTADKKTEQDTTNTETVTEDTEIAEDIADDNEPNKTDCSECLVPDCTSCDKKCCREDKSCCTDTTYDDEKNDYFTRIGNILTDWIKPWVTYKDNSSIVPRKFDYEIDEVLKYDIFDSSNDADINDRIFDILDTAVFKMLVVGHNKTCKLTITWKLENDYTYTFTFFWDPETCAFYGYMNNYDPDSTQCLKYNEQTRRFNTLYKTELGDYIKGVLSSETSCGKNTSADTVDTVSAETETTNTADRVNAEATPVESRKDTAANIYKRYNTPRPIDRNSGEIWDRIIKATDQLFDYGGYTPESANGETYAILFFPETLLDEDGSLPDNTFDRLNYDDYKDVLKTRYGFPLVTVLDKDMSVGIDEPFIRCYLK